MPDDWANFGEIFKSFCQQYACAHEDTDMSSAEEITKFDAEKNNPQASVADIGMPFGPLAVKKGVTLAYKNASWDKVPDWAKDKDGNWVGSYVGVPAILVNTDIVKNPPRTWSDLLKPEYKNMVTMNDPRSSGSGVAPFLAVNKALGGTESNMQPAIDFFTKLNKSGNLKPGKVSAGSIQKGEQPIVIHYDFLLNSYKDQFAKDAKLEIFVPTEGSLYAPSALMLNKYTSQPNRARLFADYLLSDEGQTLLAKFGARPIRYVAGNLTLKLDDKKAWLPDAAYEKINIGSYSDWAAASPEKIAAAWNQVLGQ
jgi:putative spermidine/putrescine transport system substrate-binding protein